MRVYGLETRNKVQVNDEKNLGTMTYANGDDYNGDWKNNKRDGKGKIATNIGKQVYANGDIYDGQWKNDKRNGIGNNDSKLCRST